MGNSFFTPICLFADLFYYLSVLIFIFIFKEDQKTFYMLAKDFSDKELKPFAGTKWTIYIVCL
jgi:hypothetical protein